MAPTWVYSPVRRVSQALCLVLFLVLFFYVCWPYGSRGYVETFRAKEIIEAEAFLALDPLVGISTALAAKTWVWSLAWAGILLAICLFFPRGFCGYLCPLGTLIDLFDWALGRRVVQFRIKRRGWWIHLKYYVLFATLVAAVFGVLLSGFIAAIPVVTRAMFVLLTPLEIGLAKGWYLIPPINAGHLVSVVLFLAVFGLSFLRSRFWCRYVCPTGAVFSVANAVRLTERKVESSCIECGKCAEVCPFDAIEADFTTRTADCTFCQTCGGACPTRSIKFVPRWDLTDLRPVGPEPVARVPLSRRGFLAGGLCAGATVLGMQRVFGATLGSSSQVFPIRPPGSVPEREFLQLCIRCDACLQACPNNALHPEGFEQGLEGIWAPQLVARWSGCEPTCNNCGQVCPTGAVRALPIEEKRVARIGLAIVNKTTCLPYAGREACQLCVDECRAAGYDAIEFMRVGVQVDADGVPIEDSGDLAPVVLADKCVGCGLCETRCYGINVDQKGLLKETAIWIEAGPGKEDRIRTGSYLALREKERRENIKAQPGAAKQPGGDDYLPDFLK